MYWSTRPMPRCEEPTLKSVIIVYNIDQSLPIGATNDI